MTFAGAHTALVTPFRDGQFDTEAFRQLIEEHRKPFGRSHGRAHDTRMAPGSDKTGVSPHRPRRREVGAMQSLEFL